MSELDPNQPTDQTGLLTFPGESINDQAPDPTAGDRIHTSAYQELGSSIQQSIHDMPIGHLWRYFTVQDKNQDGPKLSPEQLNEMYPEVDKPFESPMTKSAAQYISDQAQERHRLQYMMEQGPHGIGLGIAKFAGGLVPSMLDPIFMAGTLATGGLFGAAAKAGYGLGVLGTERGAAALASHAIEGAVTMGAMEPINFADANAERDNYTLADSVANVGMGTVYGVGLGLLGKGLKGAWKYFRGSPEAEAIATKTAVAQAASDRKIDIMPIIDQQLRETSGEVHPDYSSPELHSPGPLPEKLSERPLYVGSPDGARDFKNAEKPKLEMDLGHGITTTDSPAVANGHASRLMSEGDGQVFKLSAQDSNLIDLEKPLPNEARQAFQEALGTTQGDQAAKFLDESSGREVIEHINDAVEEGHLPEETLSDINRDLKGQGFDGYSLEGNQKTNPDAPTHNVVHFFDPEETGDAGGKLSVEGKALPDQNLVPTITEDQARAGANNRQSIEHDSLMPPEEIQKYRETMNAQGFEAPGESEIKQRTDQMLDEIKALQKQGALLPEEEEALSELKDFEQRVKEREELERDAAICVARAE